MKEVYSPNLGRDEQPYFSFALCMPREPQRFAKGGLAAAAKRVAAAGRFGDDVLIHVNKAEAEQIRRAWGEPTIHPKTGLPEYWWKELLKTIVSSPTTKKVITNAALGAAAAAVTGNSVGKGALVGGVTGGLGAMGTAGNLGSLSKAASYMDLTSGPLSGASAAVPGGGMRGTMVGPSGGSGGGGLSSLLSGMVSGAKKDPLAALALVSRLATRANPNVPSSPRDAILDPNFSMHLPQLDFNRKRRELDPNSYYTYGEHPEQAMYDNNQLPVAAHADGGAIAGPGTGRSDDIPARLSDGEYVMDAETVALLGDGSTQAGAKRLDEMRRKLRTHKGKALAKGKFSPAAKAPDGYMKKGGK